MTYLNLSKIEDKFSKNLTKYELFVTGMKCSNCSTNLEKKLEKYNGIISVNINLIMEKLFISVEEDFIIDNLKDFISNLGFEVVSLNKLRNNDNKRIFSFTCKELINEEKYEQVKEISGVEQINNQNKLTKIVYDPFIIKGSKLFKNLESIGISFDYLNCYKEKIDSLTVYNNRMSNFSFIILILLTTFLLFFCMFKSELGDYLKATFIFTKINLFLIINFLISLMIILKFGISIYLQTFKNIFLHKIYNMDTLITIGSISSILLTILYLVKLYNVDSNDKLLLDSLIMRCVESSEASASVISISLIGKFLEERVKLKMKNFTSNLIASFSDNNERVVKLVNQTNKNFQNVQITEVDAGLVEKDEYISLTVNDYVHIDGIIVKGEIIIIENVTFGDESKVKKTIGDKILSGTKIVNGECIYSTEEVLESSLLFKITKDMTQSVSNKLNLQNTINKIMIYFVPFIILLSLLSIVIWTIIYLIYDYEITFNFIIERGISILVVSCPCAFGLAIPIVTLIIHNIALKEGILIRNSNLLQEVRKAERFVFDKTGTLTDLSDDLKIEFLSNFDSLPLIELIADLEKEQKHPIAQKIYAYCLKNEKKQFNKEYNIISVSYSSNGLEANILFNNENLCIKIGNFEFVKIEGEKYFSSQNSHKNYVYVVLDNSLKLIFSIDTSSIIRNESSEIISYLKLLDKEVYIISGDNEEGVKRVGKSLGIEEQNCFGSVTNYNKRHHLTQLKKDKKVLMIGDGVNDVLCLSEADYGISFNTNSNLNLLASDFVFIKKDLRLILTLLKLSKVSFIFIWINLFWAFIYNIIMLPIAAGIYSNIKMSPTSSSFSMLMSSLLIIITSNLIWLINFNFINKPIKENSEEIKLCINQ